MFKNFCLSLLLTLAMGGLFSCADFTDSTSENQPVKLGAERLIDEYLLELEGQRIGLVMNPTARIGETHMLDSLLSLDANITALFAPEHGFRGEAGAGDRIEDGVDQESGLPVFSLYGNSRKPTAEMLQNIDLLIFDMQDVGVRFYTYIATLGLVLEAASEADIPVWVLDRPNPLGGNYVSGWMLEEEFESFVGAYPIPIAHGLTMGEMATMIVGESWMDFENTPKLKVIEMDGWTREMQWPETGLNWIPPSPNLPTFDHAFLYAGTVFFEGTTLSEGRGTDDPFLVLGDPRTELSPDDMEVLTQLDGISVEPHTFTPKSIEGVAPNPKHLDRESHGIKVTVQRYDIDPVRTGLTLLEVLVNATPGAEVLPFIYRLSGSEDIDRILNNEVSAEQVVFGTESYLDQRRPYLLYE